MTETIWTPDRVAERRHDKWLKEKLSTPEGRMQDCLERSLPAVVLREAQADPLWNTQLRDLLDLRARGERAVFLTVGDDVFGCRRVQARDLPQQRSGSRIEVYADRVDARLDHAASAAANSCRSSAVVPTPLPS